MIRLTDNRFGDYASFLTAVENCWHCSSYDKTESNPVPDKDMGKVQSLLQKCADKTLKELKNDNLIIFAKEEDLDEPFIKIPAYQWVKPEDEIRIETGNMMGVLYLQGEGTSLKVQIKSRFDTGEKQYFLNYLLSKVFDVSFADLISSNDDAMWDLLLAFVFVWKFRKAAEVGLYKQYHTNEYNDLNFRGKLDLDRHLKRNYPLCDRIAYSKREITFDNPMNHLLRSAVAKIERKWPSMLESDSDVQSLVTALKQATPMWNSCGVAKILNHKDTRFPVRQPFFAEYYEPLRKIARMLLQDEGANVFDTSTESSDTEISGIVFDGAWLWEEYIATVLTDYTHAIYQSKGGIAVFEGKEKPKFYPDFWNPEKKIVLDTKYKVGKNTGKREDIHQVLCYMYLTGATRGGLIYPPGEKDNELDENHEYKINTTSRKSCWKNFMFDAIKEKDRNTDRDFIKYMVGQEKKLKDFSQQMIFCEPHAGE